MISDDLFSKPRDEYWNKPPVLEPSKMQESYFVRVSVPQHLGRIAQFMARKAEVGGVSRIHKNHGERLERQRIDSMVGQMGTLAGCIMLTGGYEDYIKSRYIQNKFPRMGDGGEDILGANIDFKVSLKRYSSMPPMDYHLLVRPAERHSNQVYIHGLIEPWEEDGLPDSVLFTGWATDKDLPEKPIESGVLSGAYAIEVKHLNRLMPITWKWFK